MNNLTPKTAILASAILCVGLMIVCGTVWAGCGPGCSTGCKTHNRWCISTGWGVRFASEVVLTADDVNTICSEVPDGGSPGTPDVVAWDMYSDCILDCELSEPADWSTGAPNGEKEDSDSGSFNTTCSES